MSAGANFYDNRIVSGPFLADPAAADNYLPGPIQLDATKFYGTDSVLVNVTTNTAADAVAIPVTALLGPIPSGTLLDFGGKKFARLTSAAAKGAVSLAVSNLPTALVASDTARYAGVGPKVAPAGTFIGRTQAEADAGTPFGPADAADDYVYLTGASVNFLHTDCTLVVRHGRAVKENFLPDWTAISAVSGLLTKLRSAYQCIKGQR